VVDVGGVDNFTAINAASASWLGRNCNRVGLVIVPVNEIPLPTIIVPLVEVTNDLNLVYEL